MKAADTAPASKGIRVLVVTGGHDFEKPQFNKVFENNPEISFRAVAHPNAHQFLKAELAKDIDVYVYYDMYQDGVFTTAVCPGFTYSEFHDVTGTRAKVSQMPAFLWMDASSVAEQGYAAVRRGEPVYINGRVNRAIARLPRVLPAGLVRRLVGSSGKRFRHVD